MPTSKAPAKKAAATKKKVAAKPAATKSTKAPAKKKGILHKLFRSQKGIIQAQKFSKTQYLLTAAVLGTIGVVGVVASHGSTKMALSAPTPQAYGCKNPGTITAKSSKACISYEQALLNYKTGSSLKVDGIYGPKTAAVVAKYNATSKATPKVATSGCPTGYHKVSQGDCQRNYTAVTPKPVTPKPATPKPATVASSSSARCSLIPGGSENPHEVRLHEVVTNTGKVSINPAYTGNVKLYNANGTLNRSYTWNSNTTRGTILAGRSQDFEWGGLNTAMKQVVTFTAKNPSFQCSVTINPQ